MFLFQKDVRELVYTKIYTFATSRYFYINFSFSLIISITAYNEHRISEYSEKSSPLQE